MSTTIEELIEVIRMPLGDDFKVATSSCCGEFIVVLAPRNSRQADGSVKKGCGLACSKCGKLTNINEGIEKPVDNSEKEGSGITP